ncbi:hypothetical protein BC830DRAFT_1141813 [Chytriomyces sp. MP71]|nr:hypothetical protein BC830DRAFT_1141813 [Chytriomyces sp. MP71]
MDGSAPISMLRHALNHATVIVMLISIALNSANGNQARGITRSSSARTHPQPPSTTARSLIQTLEGGMSMHVCLTRVLASHSLASVFV